MANRILIFSLAYFPVEGGAEIAVREITDRLGDTEFDLITKKFDESHKGFERVGNVGVYRIDSSKALYPIRAYWEAKKLNKTRVYTTVWSIMAAYAGLAGLLFKLKFPRVRFVLTLQEGDSLGHIHKRMSILKPIFKKIFAKADIVQAISNFLGGWGRDMGASNVVVIPNGVDVNKFKPTTYKLQTTNQITLITTSRLVEKNAVSDIIEALKYLPDNVHLKILGSGPLESALKLQTKNCNLQTHVQFLGHIDYSEVPKYLHQADLFVRPSLSEGFGNSFIEAMAAGLPVIATPVGGIVDFLEDGKTGLFCEPNNPESIARAVERLIADELLRENLIDNALALVRERYSWDLIAREMEDKVF